MVQAEKLTQTYVNKDSRDDASSMWKCKRFHTREVEYDTKWPCTENVEHADKAEEELHVNSGFVLDADLEENDVKRVEQRREERERVPEQRPASRALGIWP